MVNKTSCGTCPCFFETFVFLPEHQTLSRVCYFPWDHVLVHLKIFIPMAMFIVNILWKYSMCLCLTGHKEKKSYWFFFCYTILTLYYHCTIINTWIVVNLDQKWVELGWCSSNIHECSKSKFFYMIIPGWEWGLGHMLTQLGQYWPGTAFALCCTSSRLGWSDPSMLQNNSHFRCSEISDEQKCGIWFVQ